MNSPIPHDTPELAPLWLKLFFAWHVVAIVVISLPAAPKNPSGFTHLLAWNHGYLQPFVVPYSIATGTIQYWNMFVHGAGEPNNWFDIKYTFRLHRADGSTRDIAYPRVSEMSQVRAIGGFRYRKFLDFAARFPHLIDSLARYYAREDQRMFKGQRVTRVEVIQDWIRIAAPGEEQTSYQRRSLKEVQIQ